MALKKCKECGKEVSTQAKQCPNCGVSKPTENTALNFLISTVILIGLFFWLFGGESETTEASVSEPKKKVHWQDKDERVTAYIMCEDFVKDRLKSPSTAEFESIWDGRTERIVQTNQRYKIRSYVDSQNSFGGTVRTNFTCIVEQTSEGKWTLQTLEMD